jgi:hypothetical protein
MQLKKRSRRIVFCIYLSTESHKFIKEKFLENPDDNEHEESEWIKNLEGTIIKKI